MVSTKTVQVSEDTHTLIIKKWVELKEKGDPHIKIAKVAEMAIQKGILMI
jgi:hypothetical protein